MNSTSDSAAGERATDADRVVAQIHEAYRARTPRSRAWYERATNSLVSGVSGSVRYFGPYPSYFDVGDGAEVTDIDGNSLIDCFLCGATLLLGHRPPAVVEAISEVVHRGSLVLNPTVVAETAEQLQSMVPAAERVRFVNSGTEAIINALRFARAFTGRSKVVKFTGTYHGMDDQMLTGLDGRNARLGGGIPASAVAETVNGDLLDLDALASTLEGGDVAAVLIDLSMHHCGRWAATPEHYQMIAGMARDAGALVIVDEVISGFRLSPGGGQQYFGITPDLAVFGKALAAGEKLGAIVGRSDVMAVSDVSSRRSGPFAFQSGTCSDSTVAQTAALVAMRSYQQLGSDGEYDRLDRLSADLGRGLRDTFAAHGISCHVNQLGPIVRLFLVGDASGGLASHEIDQAHCTRLPSRPIDSFHLALVAEGVLTLPGSNDFFLSFSHTPAHVDRIVEAANRVLDRYDIGALMHR